MTTYLMRHGRTDYSVRYLVNGDRQRPVHLDEEGVRATCAVRKRVPATGIRSIVTSEFPRTKQTAQLLLDGAQRPVTAEVALNELDYGAFEGGPFLEYARWLRKNGPWARPPQAAESQREGKRRMLGGLQAVLRLPGPRLVVGHGLMMSMLFWHQQQQAEEGIPLFLPEAPYLEPLALDDGALADAVRVLGTRLREEAPFRRGMGTPGISSDGESTALGHCGPVSTPLEENETDA